MKLFALTILAASLFATAAGATPALRSEVSVVNEIVTVGDMFDNPGNLAEKALFRAPAPGTSGMVSLEAVAQAAAIAGVTDYTADGVLRVRVARTATIVDVPAMTGIITADLRLRGIVADGVTAQTTFDNPALSFNAEAVDNPVQLVNLRYTPGNSVFAARFIIAGIDAPVDVTGRIELMIEAPHLVAMKPAGAVLAPEDIEMRLVPLRNAETLGAASLDQLVGKQLTRQSRAGLMLRPSDVTEPRVVERNAMVTVVLSKGMMTLTVKGQALNAAAVGEPVQVLNNVSRKILYGVALENGAVEVTNTIAVAGL